MKQLKPAFQNNKRRFYQQVGREYKRRNQQMDVKE